MFSKSKVLVGAVEFVGFVGFVVDGLMMMMMMGEEEWRVVSFWELGMGWDGMGWEGEMKRGRWCG